MRSNLRTPLGSFCFDDGSKNFKADQDNNFNQSQFGLQLASANHGFRVNLVQHESKGGHTISFHVNKSHGFLIGRLRSNRYSIPAFTIGLKRAGSYTSLSSATRLTNATLSAHSATVQQVASGSLKQAVLDRPFGSPTGYEAYTTGRSAPIIRETFGVRVHIIHNPGVPGGFLVNTSFPMNFGP
jgi:hypothetical protein